MDSNLNSLDLTVETLWVHVKTSERNMLKISQDDQSCPSDPRAVFDYPLRHESNIVKHCIHNGYSSAFETQIYVKGLGENKFL